MLVIVHGVELQLHWIRHSRTFYGHLLCSEYLLEGAI